MLATEIVKSVQPSDSSPVQIGREFRELVEGGVPLRPAGAARKKPRRMLSLGYTPKYKIQLFDVTYYVCNLRFDENFGFMVAYVMLPEGRRSKPVLYPRIFYKDLSLVWRSPTHYIRSEADNWIGKGDLKSYRERGLDMEYSAEETTDLPLEIQAALDAVSRLGGKARRDNRAVDLVLRNAPDGRFEPYDDFLAPRRRAMSDPKNLINGGRFIARFTRPGDPSSLRFAPGFAPDFDDGILDRSQLASRMYGGAVSKLRILSENRKIQYQFIAAPRHVWIIPPQALTTEIMSYGMRTVDVNADSDLFVPGFEYHFLDEFEDPPELYSQIPEGFAGAPNEVDPFRADASRWLDALPVIQEFRKKVRLPR